MADIRRIHKQGDYILADLLKEVERRYNALDRYVAKYVDQIANAIDRHNGIKSKYIKDKLFISAVEGIAKSVSSTNAGFVETLNESMETLYDLSASITSDWLYEQVGITIPEVRKNSEQIKTKYDKRAVKRNLDNARIKKDVVRRIKKTVTSKMTKTEINGAVRSSVRRSINGGRVSMRSMSNIDITRAENLAIFFILDALHIDNNGIFYDPANGRYFQCLKEWHTVGDQKVRDTHTINARLGEVPFDFIYPNNQKYPADPNGDVGEYINCRCWITCVIRYI